MIDPAVMADIRNRINPQYQDTIGTESYERKLLVDEIDRLNNCSANCPLFHGNAAELQRQTATEIIAIIEAQPWVNVPDYEEHILAEIRGKYGVEG